MKKCIFRFRQDLRVFDNRGLYEACNDFDKVLPIFIFDENLIQEFEGTDRFIFIQQAIKKLKKKLIDKGGDLKVVKGKPEEQIPRLIEKYDIDSVLANKCYDEYGIQRDESIQKDLKQKGKEFKLIDDFLLVKPELIKPYKVYNWYRKKWKKQLPEKIDLLEPSNISVVDFDSQDDIDFFGESGGKHPCFEVEDWKNKIKNFDFQQYSEKNDRLDKNGTSKLSPYIRFGILSIRQLYNKAMSEKALDYVKELAWRDFWHQIIYHYPETRVLSLQEERRNINRENDKDKFYKFCNAQTGYPIIDAAIKQLKTENWMHGRARMIVGSFLTKDLLIDWRWGEQFFAKHLLDYDENVNIGNWQWAGGVGSDFGYVRVFNPSLQSSKFDPQAKYIKKYLPKLEDKSIEDIHNPLEGRLDYAEPIVDHKKRAKKAKKVIKKQLN